MHTPLITTCDAEDNSGELFAVEAAAGTAQPSGADASDKAAGGEKGQFFGQAAYLSVSGQLNAEALACSLGQVRPNPAVLSGMWARVNSSGNLPLEITLEYRTHQQKSGRLY